MSTSCKPSKQKERRWMAEDIVRRLWTSGPEYEAAVQRAIKEMGRVEKVIRTRKK